MFSSESYIPLLALIFSEYHAAKVSQDEIERDISNRIKSFKIRELPLGLDAKDSHSLYDALLNNNLIKKYFNANEDLNLMHYSYVIEIQFNSNISEMYNLSVLFSYFQLYNAQIEKTDIINIRDISNIEYYSEELCVGKQKSTIGDRHITLCCFDDKASEQSIFINCNDENNSSSQTLREDLTENSKNEENKIRTVMDRFINDEYDNVSSYKKSFILGLNFYPRQEPRKVYRYRLFPRKGMRQFSDNDILIRKKDIIAADKIMTNRSYEYEKGYELNVSKIDYQTVIPYFKDHLFNFEIHNALFYLWQPNSGVRGKYYKTWANMVRYFDKTWERAIKSDGDNRAYNLKDENFYFYFLAHFYRHYRLTGGAGFRSFVDFYYVRKSLTLDHYINQCFIEAGCPDLEVFEKEAETIADSLFGDSQNELSSETLRYVAASGAYGSHENSKKEELKRRSKFAIVCYARID